MIRSLLIIILITTFYEAECSDYKYRTLYEMAIKADKIVYGVVEETGFQRFKFKIEGSLTGESGSIFINTVKDRWTEYEVGQRVLLFLEYFDRGLYIMNYQSGGEFPIVNDSIFISGLSLPVFPPPGLGDKYKTEAEIASQIQEYDVYNSKYIGWKFNFEDLLISLRMIRDCFEFEYGEFNAIVKRKKLCSERVHKEMESSYLLVKWVAEEWRKNER